MNRCAIGLLSILLSFAAGTPANAARARDEAADTNALARRWDHINFEVHDNQVAQTEAGELEQQAEALAESDPHNPEPLIWEALAVLAKADARHNFSSLSLADRARHLLEKASAMGASGEDGAFADAVLGTLYDEMPGFPLGFGDRRKAGVWFSKAVSVAPDDIDVNVLYGTYLLHQRDYAGAAAAAKRALAAKPQPDREMRDRYRRQEAQALLAKAEPHAGTH